MAASYRFVPTNPDKYAGDPRRIVARSRWEYVYMGMLDRGLNVQKWMSEPKQLGITYVNPLDRKVHKYWPDFLVQYKDGSIELVEIKPQKEASMESARSKYDKLMLARNIAKWKAAEAFALKIGARFVVITENALFKGKQ